MNPDDTLRSEFLQVAYQLFGRFRRPLSARELINLGMREGLFSDKRSGKTPHQTMKAKLSVHIRRTMGNSIFIRTAPGRFYLRELVGSRADIFEPVEEKQLSFPPGFWGSSAETRIYNANPIHAALSRERVLLFASKYPPH